MFEGTVDLWPFIVLVEVIPAVTSLAIMPFVPDTPRYLLLIRNNRPDALKCESYGCQYISGRIKVIKKLVRQLMTGNFTMKKAMQQPKVAVIVLMYARSFTCVFVEELVLYR